MRKRMKFKKNMLIKSTAVFIILCMTIGSIYFPVFAEESGGEPSVSETGDMVSDDLVNEDDESEDNEGTEEKEPEAEKENEGKETVSGNDIRTEEPEGTEEEEKKEEIEEEEKEEEIEEEEKEEKSDDKQEIPEIVNVVIPATYTLALNPYSLPIRISEDEISTEQVISGTYGIVNKSSADQIVKVLLTVEDMNGGELVFVDSAEEARNAEENVYAVYLAAVPADEREILVEGLPADINTLGESLQNVRMDGAQEQAVTLYDGMNQIAFKLSQAVYGSENDEASELVLTGLAPDGSGVTAYTFHGAMNPNAEWENLSGGIKISVSYTYQTADGNEEIIEGTGAMIRID